MTHAGAPDQSRDHRGGDPDEGRSPAKPRRPAQRIRISEHELTGLIAVEQEEARRRLTAYRGADTSVMLKPVR